MLVVVCRGRSSAIGVGHALGVVVLVTHLRTKARAAAAAHETVSSKIGHFKGCQLTRNLPILTGKQDNGP